MLLHKWEKYSHKMQYPVIVQPKIDGVRCMWDSDDAKLYSREGKVISLPHITDALIQVGLTSCDGELAYEDYTVPLPEVVHGIAHEMRDICFHIFDRPVPGTFKERFAGNSPHLVAACEQVDCLKIVAMALKYSEDEVKKFYDACVAHDMEGIVVRNPDSEYLFGKRSNQVLKYKFEIEGYFEIIDWQAIPHPQGDLVMFVCETEDEKRFEVVPAWKHEERREMLLYLRTSGSYDGVLTLVEYRGLTPDGKPNHAVGKTKFKELMKAFQGK
jgi:DNA ligase-1